MTAVQPAADGISVNAAASAAFKGKQRERTEALRPSVSVRSFSNAAEQQQAASSRCRLEEVNVWKEKQCDWFALKATDKEFSLRSLLLFIIYLVWKNPLISGWRDKHQMKD